MKMKSNFEYLIYFFLLFLLFFRLAPQITFSAKKPLTVFWVFILFFVFSQSSTPENKIFDFTLISLLIVYYNNQFRSTSNEKSN